MSDGVGCRGHTTCMERQAWGLSTHLPAQQSAHFVHERRGHCEWASAMEERAIAPLLHEGLEQGLRTHPMRVVSLVTACDRTDNGDGPCVRYDVPASPK